MKNHSSNNVNSNSIIPRLPDIKIDVPIEKVSLKVSESISDKYSDKFLSPREKRKNRSFQQPLLLY